MVRSQQVFLECTSSSTWAVDSGVPQGTVLGPLLFLVFINDLPEAVTSHARLFADDCLLYRVINISSDQIELQKDLDQLQTWEHTWQMSFNADKCFTIHITKKRTIRKHSYKLYNQVLQETTDSKYLGVTISTILIGPLTSTPVPPKLTVLLDF